MPEALAEIYDLLVSIDANQAQCNERLEMLEAQIAANQGELNQRFDDADSKLTHLDDIPQILDDVTPCTIERFRAGDCQVLNGEASVCFTVALGAEAGLSYSVEPGMDLKVGAAWHAIPKGDLDYAIEVPLVGMFSYVPVIYPDLNAGLNLGAEGAVEVCIANVSFPIGGGKAAVDEFVQQLVDALQARGGELAETAASIATERKLDPGRLADAMNAVREFEGGGFEVKGPLDEFKPGGKVRALIDALPSFDDADDSKRVSNLLDNIDSFIPDADPTDSLALCDDGPLSRLGGLRPKVEGVCELVDTMPDLGDLASKIRNLPTATADRLCETIPSLDCDGDSLAQRRQCRSNCRSTSRACKQDCGFLQIKCRRECEKREDNCLDGC